MEKTFSTIIKKKKLIGLIPILGGLYLIFFRLLEASIADPGTYHLITCPFDKYIPFNEYFVVFYLSWFLFVLLAFGYAVFLEKDKEYANRFILYIFAGMYLFLLISWIYPNGLAIRPRIMPRENIFTALCRLVYSNDTPTNVFPSIHCFNSVAIYLAAKNSETLKKRKIIVAITGIWALLIVLSTLFLKQHSVYDAGAGVILGYALYALIYQTSARRVTAYSKARMTI